MRKLCTLLLIVLLLAACVTVASAAEATLYTISSVKDRIRIGAEALEPSISFKYSSSLDPYFADYDAMKAMLDNHGVMSWRIYIDHSKREVTAKELEYRSGFRAIRAYKLGKTSQLTYDQKRTYEKAQSVVAAARKTCKTTLQYELYFHDYLCENVTYHASEEEGTIYDTAVGALLYGMAECDGYSDAFYMLCSLAGINCAYQHGDADGPHMWNLIELNGKWYMVDVTWDDNDESRSNKLNGYRYTNVGYWFMSDHTFNRECAAHSVEPYVDWDLFFYTAPSKSGVAQGTYYEKMSDAASYLVKQAKKKRAVYHVMVQGSHNFDEMNAALKKAWKRNGSGTINWYVYTVDLDGYTCYDVYFYR